MRIDVQDLLPPHFLAGIEYRLCSVVHDVRWSPVEITLRLQKRTYELEGLQVRSTVFIATYLHRADTEDTSHVGSA